MCKSALTCVELSPVLWHLATRAIVLLSYYDFMLLCFLFLISFFIHYAKVLLSWVLKFAYILKEKM